MKKENKKSAGYSGIAGVVALAVLVALIFRRANEGGKLLGLQQSFQEQTMLFLLILIAIVITVLLAELLYASDGRKNYYSRRFVIFKYRLKKFLRIRRKAI
ncbi:MAG: hypothetical protein WCL13_01450 [bacterium]